jgi:hypothetical protein
LTILSERLRANSFPWAKSRAARANERNKQGRRDDSSLSFCAAVGSGILVVQLQGRLLAGDNFDAET